MYMSLRGSQPDPYTESGGYASAQEVRRMRREALVSSVTDADSLQARGYAVIRRGVRDSRMALGCMLLCGAAMVGCAWVTTSSYDGTYEGVMTANWGMLGVVLAAGALNFAWGWFSSRRQLRHTGERLIRRAEYQRKLATMQLTEGEHDAIR